MNKTIRIGGALILAIGLILGAFWLREQNLDEKNGTAVTVKETTSTQLEIEDSDGDGVPDWKEALQQRAYEQITVPTTTFGIDTSAAEYVPPTTFTGQFTEAFMEDYLQGKIGGADYSNPDFFAEEAVEAIRKSAESRKYSRAELILVPATEEAVRDYGNEVATVILRHGIENSEHELEILQKAVQANDASLLSGLKPLANSYQNILSDALKIAVPEILAMQHVNFLNALQAVSDGIISMEIAFTDPLLTLARVSTYNDDTQSLYNYFIATDTIITEYGVVYTNDEPGSFFYIFDAI